MKEKKKEIIKRKNKIKNSREIVSNQGKDNEGEKNKLKKGRKKN